MSSGNKIITVRYNGFEYIKHFPIPFHDSMIRVLAMATAAEAGFPISQSIYFIGYNALPLHYFEGDCLGYLEPEEEQQGVFLDLFLN